MEGQYFVKFYANGWTSSGLAYEDEGRNSLGLEPWEGVVGDVDPFERNLFGLGPGQ
jgi:hypothetical protein